MKLILIAIPLLLFSCSTETNDQKQLDPITEKEKTAIPNEDIEQTSLTATIFTKSYSVESRLEMREILNLLSIDKQNSTIAFKHVNQTEGGYTQSCPEGYNGLLQFLLEDSEEFEDFFSVSSPIIEHQTQDLFYYVIEDMFINKSSQEITLKTRYLQFDGEQHYLDMALPKTYLYILFPNDSVPVIKFEKRYFMDERFIQHLATGDCPEIEH